MEVGVKELGPVGCGGILLEADQSQVFPLDYLGIRSSNLRYFGYLEPVECETDARLQTIPVEKDRNYNYFLHLVEYNLNILTQKIVFSTYYFLLLC